MKFRRIAIWCVMLFIQKQIINAENSEKRKFTHEWQELGPDEAIPTGLHVRINLQTGKKEAKLLEGGGAAADDGRTSLALAEPAPPGSDELRQRLSRLPDDGPEPLPEEIESVKKKFRPYEELKKEFENMKMSVKTDFELMGELFASFQKAKENEAAAESVLSVLTDLSYMVHQVDNAGEFVRAGGLQLIVYPSLNSTSPEVRSQAARLLGSAVQNNAPLQIKALESGAVGALLHMLSLDPSAAARSSALFALGCVSRRFPLAQTMLVREGGVRALASLFDAQDSLDSRKIQLKAVTFVDDMLVEREDADATEREFALEAEGGAGEEEARERVRQYEATNLLSALFESHWCGHLSGLLERELPAGLGAVDSWPNAVVGPDLDNVEKITRAMLTAAQPCRDEFLKDARVKKLTLSLIRWLKEVASEEKEDDDEGYYRGLQDQVKKLAEALGFLQSSH